MTIVFLIIAIFWLVIYGLARWLHGRGRPDWHQDVLAAGLLGLACLGYFWRVLWGGAFMPADGGDLISFLYPAYRFAAETLRSGQWPLWNPHLYGGAPHVADIQAGFLYPPNLLLFFLKPDFGAPILEGMGILHFWWAGLGMYAFLRSLRRIGPADRPGHAVGRPAALAAGIAFAFSDPFWVHFGNLNLIAAASWLPWVMACVVRALEEGADGERAGRQGISKQETDGEGEGAGGEGSRLTPHASRFTLHVSRLTLHASRFTFSVLGGLLLGVGTLAGHIQSTLFVGLAVVIYGLFWLYGEWRESRAGIEERKSEIAGFVFRFAAVTLIVALVAMLIAAPVLLPALELTRYSARAAWSYGDTVGFSLSPAQWIGFLIPGFFGRGPQLHWGLWPRVEVGYIGILPLALAALALLARRERRTWALAGLSAAAFLLALGVYSIPHGWLSLIPGFDLLRAPARFALLVDFGLAALAGIGLQVLIEPLSEGENWKALGRLNDGLAWAAKAVLAVAVPLTFAALLLAQDRDPAVYLRVGVAAIAVLLFVAFLLASLGLVAARRAGWASPNTIAALAMALIFLDLASTGAYNDLSGQDPARGFEHPEIAAYLAQVSEPVRIDARTDIDTLWQPNTALLYGLDDVWGIANPSLLVHYERYWESMGSRSSRLYDFLNAGYVIGRKDVVLDWDKFELAFDGDPNLNLYRNRDALRRASVVHEAWWAESAELAWNLIHEADFDPSRQVVVQAVGAQLPALQPASGPEPVIWLRRDPNESLLEVTTTAPGLLALSEVWYPGWRAEVQIAGQVQEQPVLRANYAFQAVPLWQAGTYRVRLRFQPAPWRIGLLLAGLIIVVVVVVAGALGLLAAKRRGAGGMSN